MAVVGGNTGGLTAVPERPAQPVQTRVLVRSAQPGGKLRELTIGRVAMEAAPTVFTMRWVVEALFEAVAARLTDRLQLKPVAIALMTPGVALLDMTPQRGHAATLGGDHEAAVATAERVSKLLAIMM